MPLEQLSDQSRRLAQIDVAGNELTLFAHSTPLIAAMLDDIAAARERVWLESYIFANDEVGQAVVRALAERAAAGLDVRLMYDAVGSFATSSALFEPLAKAGGKVHAYHSLREVLWRRPSLRLLNRRDHRKLLVVDDRAAYFGGMNIVDQSGIDSVQDARAAHLPPSAGWRDLHVRLTGPQQAEVAVSFDRLWQAVHGWRRPLGPRWPIRAMLRDRGDGVYLFDCRPAFRYRRAARVLAPLIRQARHDITVAMAYFIPVGRVLRELIRARRRGVRVRVVVPADNDVKAVQYAMRHFYSYLLRRGVRIYERQDQMLHSKTMVIDGRSCVIGSCNLDPRSLRINLEFLSVIHSRAFAETVQRICQFEIDHSRRITAADCRARNCWWRLIDRLAWSLRRWL